MKTHSLLTATAVLFFTLANAQGANAPDDSQLESLTRAELPRVIEWRRDIHEHPELSNREVRTAKIVAEHLRGLGLEVQTGIAHTGVAGWLKGGRPGPTLALRADMDALPVTEKTDVPFRSKVTSTYRGQNVGVMHACGHDSHVAMLMGVAQILSSIRQTLPGNVLFIFQPAEEGAPEGESGGASLMLKEGLFEKHKPDAAFGMHVWSSLRVGEIGVRAGPLMAASDPYKIVINGKQTHGSRPWQGVDPIVAAAQLINALQTVISRYVDITENPAVVSVGAINGGIRNNIIPERVEMIGTIRSFDAAQRAAIIERMGRIVQGTAAVNGAQASFEVDPNGYPVLINDPKLTEQMLPSLKQVAGVKEVKAIPLVTAAEDFTFFARRVPSVYFFVGITPPDRDPKTAPANHSDYFFIDESGIDIGLRAMTRMAVDYLHASPPAT